jgi:hypothetical protein
MTIKKTSPPPKSESQRDTVTPTTVKNTGSPGKTKGTERRKRSGSNKGSGRPDTVTPE